MTIMDHLPFIQTEDSKKPRPEIDAPTIEWMAQLAVWQESVVRADTELSNSNDSSDDGLEEYESTIGAIDTDIGEYAEHIAQQPPLRFKAAGKYKEPLSDDGDFWRPHEQYMLSHAILIYKRIRTDNSQALVEALLLKYSDENWWPLTATYKNQYEDMVANLKEPSLNSR